MRIPAPNYTQTPNDLFDHWLPLLSGCELKVLMVIIRQTFGWHRIRDKISITQLVEKTGSTATNILNSIKSLIEKGAIKKEVVGPIGKQETYYELVIIEDSNNSYPSYNGSPPPPKKGVVSREETPPNLGVTKETQKKQQINVVVVGGENPPPNCVENVHNSKEATKRTITKDDVYHYSLAAKTDWLPPEIEEAWRCYSNSKNPITDPMKYIEGIINKKRILNTQQNRGQTQCQSKYNNKNTSNETLESIKPKPLEYDMSVQLLAKYA
jgi:phage replication O-like protein O